jgi:hypothetical protein
MKDERNYGKTCCLGLGFQMGPNKFRATCAIGPMGAPPIVITEEQAIKSVLSYRSRHAHVKNSWDWNHEYGIAALVGKRAVERGPVIFCDEAITLPNGMQLQYPNLRFEDRDAIWGIDGRIHKLYGGIIQENIVQALAQIVCKYFMLKLKREFAGIAAIVHQVHDEIILCCHEREAQQVLRRAIEIMSIPPDWCPNLPVRAEGGFARNYSK